MKYFTKEDGVDRRKGQADMDPDPDEEEMEDNWLNDEGEFHWRVVFDDNDGVVGDKK